MGWLESQQSYFKQSSPSNSTKSGSSGWLESQQSYFSQPHPQSAQATALNHSNYSAESVISPEEGAKRLMVQPESQNPLQQITSQASKLVQSLPQQFQALGDLLKQGVKTNIIDNPAVKQAVNTTNEVGKQINKAVAPLNLTPKGGVYQGGLASYTYTGDTIKDVSNIILTALNDIDPVLSGPVQSIEGFSKSKAIVGGVVQAGVQLAAGQTPKDVIKNLPFAIALGAKGKETLVSKLEEIKTTAVEQAKKDLPKTFTPKEAWTEVVSSNLVKTPLGKEILKTAFNAENIGNEIQISHDPSSKLKTPIGLPVKVEIVEPTTKSTTKPITVAGSEITKGLKPEALEAPGITELKTEAKSPIYSSAESFAKEKLATKVGNLIGEIDPNKVVARDPIDPGTVSEYKTRIQAGEKIEPIMATVEDGQLITTDGSQRLTAYQQLGQKAPIIVTKFDTPIDGLKTIGDFYREAKSAETAQEVAQPIKKDVAAQAPVDAEPKISKAARDINTSLVKKGFESIPADEQAKYTPVKKAEQIKNISDLMTTDIEKAKAAATGKEPVPAGILPQPLFNAIEQHAIETGDVQLLRDLAKSPVATQLSEAGQALGSHGFNDTPNSPVDAIKRVADARAEAIKAKTGKTVEKAITDTVKQIKDSVKKPSKSDWASFIQELRC